MKNWKNANLTCYTYSSDIFLLLYVDLAISWIDLRNFFTNVAGKSGKSSLAMFFLVPILFRVTEVCGIYDILFESKSMMYVPSLMKLCISFSW